MTPEEFVERLAIARCPYDEQPCIGSSCGCLLNIVVGQLDETYQYDFTGEEVLLDILKGLELDNE